MFKKTLSLFVIFCFFLTSLGPIPKAHADSILNLPAPGTMVNLSPAYQPVIIKGLTIHKDNPFLFDFIVDVGQDKMSGEPLKKEGEKLIKYFLASLAIPDQDLWVNLSPYEKTRMVPDALGQTDMGRDLLEQDYILKQITASLIYPEKQLGKKFWDRVYSKAQQMYGTTQVPVNTFNKVWIMADRAEVFEHNQTAFVVDQHLKVMLEEDYLALQKHATVVIPAQAGILNKNNIHSLSSQIIRQIILPELEKEVNTGKNFANLRQIFNSIILSSWYKKNLKAALLNQVYSDKSKIKGINLNDPTVKQQIYDQYLQAYKRGVFNYIKEDVNAAGETMPRKYFSGGINPGRASVNNLKVIESVDSQDFAMAYGPDAKEDFETLTSIAQPSNAAMKVDVTTYLPAEFFSGFRGAWFKKQLESELSKVSNDDQRTVVIMDGFRTLTDTLLRFEGQYQMQPHIAIKRESRENGSYATDDVIRSIRANILGILRNGNKFDVLNENYHVVTQNISAAQQIAESVAREVRDGSIFLKKIDQRVGLPMTHLSIIIDLVPLVSDAYLFFSQHEKYLVSTIGFTYHESTTPIGQEDNTEAQRNIYSPRIVIHPDAAMASSSDEALAKIKSVDITNRYVQKFVDHEIALLTPERNIVAGFANREAIFAYAQSLGVIFKTDEKGFGSFSYNMEDTARSVPMSNTSSRDPNDAGTDNNWIDSRTALDQLLPLIKGGHTGKIMWTLPAIAGPSEHPVGKPLVQVTDSLAVVLQYYLLYDEGEQTIGEKALEVMNKRGGDNFIKISHVTGDLDNIKRTNLRNWVLQHYQFEAEGLDFDAILPKLIQKGYVNEGRQVNDDFKTLDAEFKSWFPNYSEEQFKKIETILKQSQHDTRAFILFMEQKPNGSGDIVDQYGINIIRLFGSEYGGNGVGAKKWASLRLALLLSMLGTDTGTSHSFKIILENKKTHETFGIKGSYPSYTGKTNSALIELLLPLMDEYRIWMVSDDLVHTTYKEEKIPDGVPFYRMLWDASKEKFVRVYVKGKNRVRRVARDINPEHGLFMVAPGMNKKTLRRAIEAINRGGYLGINLAYKFRLNENGQRVAAEQWWEENDKPLTSIILEIAQEYLAQIDNDKSFNPESGWYDWKKKPLRDRLKGIDINDIRAVVRFRNSIASNVAKMKGSEKYEHYQPKTLIGRRANAQQAEAVRRGLKAMWDVMTGKGNELAHPNSRISIPIAKIDNWIGNAAKLPKADRPKDWDNPDGQTTEAEEFAGRLATTRPLMAVMPDPMMGLLHGFFMRAAATAAEEGKVGQEAFDTEALRPFMVGSNGVFAQHRIDRIKWMGPDAPLFVYLNVFLREQKPDGTLGPIMYPGYKQNIRLRKWYKDLKEGKIPRDEYKVTFIGIVPTENASFFKGLNLSLEYRKQLTTVDPLKWRDEVLKWINYSTNTNTLKMDVPDALRRELEKLVDGINQELPSELKIELPPVWTNALPWAEMQRQKKVISQINREFKFDRYKGFNTVEVRDMMRSFLNGPATEDNIRATVEEIKKSAANPDLSSEFISSILEEERALFDATVAGPSTLVDADEAMVGDVSKIEIKPIRKTTGYGETEIVDMSKYEGPVGSGKIINPRSLQWIADLVVQDGPEYENIMRKRSERLAAIQRGEIVPGGEGDEMGMNEEQKDAYGNEEKVRDIVTKSWQIDQIPAPLAEAGAILTGNWSPKMAMSALSGRIITAEDRILYNEVLDNLQKELPYNFIQSIKKVELKKEDGTLATLDEKIAYVQRKLKEVQTELAKQQKVTPVRLFADMQDAKTVHGDGHLEGPQTISDVVNGRQGNVVRERDGKVYTVPPQGEWPVITVRISDLDVTDRHMTYDGKPIPEVFTSLVFLLESIYDAIKDDPRQAYALVIPKLESVAEMRFLVKMVMKMQEKLGITRNIPLIFMNETNESAVKLEVMLWAGRHHIKLSNVGRWDKGAADMRIFWFWLKKVYGDLAKVDMLKPLMDDYVRGNVVTSHKHGILPEGGMVTTMPSEGNLYPDDDKMAIQSIVVDKMYEWLLGYNFGWAASPSYVPLVQTIYQLSREWQPVLEDLPYDQLRQKLLAFPEVPLTESGVYADIYETITYQFGYRNTGAAVAIDSLSNHTRGMFDGATGKKTNYHLWMLYHAQSKLTGTNTVVTEALLDQMIDKVMADKGKRYREFVPQSELDIARIITKALIKSKHMVLWEKELMNYVVDDRDPKIVQQKVDEWLVRYNAQQDRIWLETRIRSIINRGWVINGKVLYKWSVNVDPSGKHVLLGDLTSTVQHRRQLADFLGISNEDRNNPESEFSKRWQSWMSARQEAQGQNKLVDEQTMSSFESQFADLKQDAALLAQTHYLSSLPAPTADNLIVGSPEFPVYQAMIKFSSAVREAQGQREELIVAIKDLLIVTRSWLGLSDTLDLGLEAEKLAAMPGGRITTARIYAAIDALKPGDRAMIHASPQEAADGLMHEMVALNGGEQLNKEALRHLKLFINGIAYNLDEHSLYDEMTGEYSTVINLSEIGWTSWKISVFRALQFFGKFQSGVPLRGIRSEDAGEGLVLFWNIRRREDARAAMAEWLYKVALALPSNPAMATDRSELLRELQVINLQLDAEKGTGREDLERSRAYILEALAQSSQESVAGTTTAPTDRASLAEKGGIDLNTSNGMQWKLSKDGNGVEMNIDPAMIARIRREGIGWLSPVILRMTPVRSVWPLVGLQAPEHAESIGV